MIELHQLMEQTTQGLSIRLFGPLDVRINGEPLPKLRSRKGQSLLALLTLRTESTVERTWLAAMLWPESAEPQALASLRQSLADLRVALGPEAHRIQTPTPHTLRLDLSGADVDVVQFDQLVRREDTEALEQAVALHKGPLLEGSLEEWVPQERGHREQAYASALDLLASSAAAGNDHAGATRYLRLLLSIDPTRESAARALMEALALTGDYNSALMVFRALRDKLYDDLNAQPDPDTVSLFRRIREETKRRAQTPSQPAATAPAVEVPTRAAQPASRIPHALTPLIGRDSDATAVADLLSTKRLVTLLGPGGVGKTRLAIHIAETYSEDLGRAAVFIDLSVLPADGAVMGAIASSLGTSERPDGAIAETLLSAIADREILLLLDNCEHVPDSCAQAASALLRHCRNVRILATSQHALGLPGEQIWPVRALTIPSEEAAQGASPEVLLKYDAVRLFVNRAQAVLPFFRLTADNAASIASIVYQLDGNPLAIEIAAARARLLTPRQIERGLADRFHMMVSSFRAAPRRHVSLSAAMEWSWGLLSPAEAAVLRRLSQFSTAANLEAAEAVCSGQGTSPDEILDVIAQLVDKSLVRVDAVGAEAVYRLLETTRTYAREQLARYGEIQLVSRKHAHYFVRLVERCADQYESHNQFAIGERLEAVHEDIRAALKFLLSDSSDDDSAMRGLRMAAYAWKFWHLRGHLVAGRQWLALALKRWQAPCVERARALGGAGVLAMEQGDSEMAYSCYSEALSVAEQLGNVTLLASATTRMGQYANAMGNREEALRYHERALALAVETQSPLVQATALYQMGYTLKECGNLEQARNCFIRCRELNEEAGNTGGIAWALHGIGDIVEQEGDGALAFDLFKQSLHLFQKLHITRCISNTLGSLAYILFHHATDPESPERTVRLLAATDRLNAAISYAAASEQEVRVEMIESLQICLGDALYSRLWSEGQAMSLEEVVAYALQMRPAFA